VLNYVGLCVMDKVVLALCEFGVAISYVPMLSTPSLYLACLITLCLF
jgi:hypothetical protein